MLSVRRLLTFIMEGTMLPTDTTDYLNFLGIPKVFHATCEESFQGIDKSETVLESLENCLDTCMDAAGNSVNEILEMTSPTIDKIRESEKGEAFLDGVSDGIDKIVEFIENNMMVAK